MSLEISHLWFQLKKRWFAASLIIFCLVAIPLSAWWVDTRVQEEREESLMYLYSRAQALVWTIEGGARFFKRQNNLSSMLEEMARQPGIAWLAIINNSGKILMDSQPGIVGAQLYTPVEMSMLKPEYRIKGRFSPDDPDIFELWKIFQPARLNMHGYPPPGQDEVIFIGLDASDLRENLEGYRRQLVIFASICLFAFICSCCLIFYIYNFYLSKNKLHDARLIAAQIMAGFPAALLLTDQNGNIFYYNSRAKQLLAINGSTIALTQLPYLDWQEILENLASGKSIMEQETELCFSHPVPVSLTAVRIIDAHGNFKGNLLIIRDMAQINQLKMQLQKSKRLSELGKLASGLAHEMRNPLSSICGYAHYLEQNSNGDGMSREAAHLLREEAQRLNGVLTELLSLTKVPQLNMSRQSLKPVLNKIIKLTLPDAAAKAVNLHLTFPEDMENQLINIDSDKLLQAILNLVLNAVQILPEGGNVYINVEKDAQEILIHVRDDGPGMSENVKNQIFTPYFTTKANGTGLGLCVAQQIVEAHHGSLTVISLPDRGTTFTIRLDI